MTDTPTTVTNHTFSDTDAPMPLPVGRTEFMEWSDRIIAKAGQFADSDSMRWALASQVIHLPPQTAFKEDSYFVNSLRKAAANQVASAIFNEIKTKQEEAKKAAEVLAASQQPAEATASTETAASNVTVQ